MPSLPDAITSRARKSRHLFAGLVRVVLLLAVVSASSPAQQPPVVPAAFQDLYDAMQTSIASFNQSTLLQWDGTKSPTIFASQLLTLNSNDGAAVLDSNRYKGFLVELNGLKALGATGVVVNIDYPTLDPNFDAWGGQSANYLSLYQRAFADIRARGLKIAVETGAVFTDPAFSSVNVGPFYQSLSLQDYMNGRAGHALIIAKQLQPDYLNVVQEPDTEALQTGKPELYTYTGSIQLLNTILAVLRSNNISLPIGAGVGTWLPPDSQGKGAIDYVRGYAATAVDSIDMHVYPVNRNYLSRMGTIADIGISANKKITMTESWSYKIRDSELGDPAFPPSVIYSRDVYSFWAPLDSEFLQAMVNFSFYKRMDFIAPFWSGYFRSYIDYNDTTAALDPTSRLSQARSSEFQQMLLGEYTSTGYAWESDVLSTPDTTPPSIPVVSASSVSSNQAVLSWNWPSDNVGVSKFTIERSGAPLATTVFNAYRDTGLTDGTSYTYTVTAYDAMNNQTVSAQLQLTTPDITAPAAPTSVTATAASGNSITVAWSGATDNVGVTGYSVYRGVNGAQPTVLTSVGTTQTYTDSNLQSAATYCYSIVARDAAGNASPASPAACTTIADGVPPSVPGGVSATGTTPPNVTVTWTASTDNVGVAGYTVQRGTTTSSFSTLVNGVKTTSFADGNAILAPDTAPPSASIAAPRAGSSVKGTITFSANVSDQGTITTYLYRVSAVDGAGNTSGWSNSAQLSWPANKSGIAGVRFLVDGMDVAPEDTVAPYSIRWNTATVSHGSHTLTVIARDQAGNTTTSAPVGIQVK